MKTLESKETKASKEITVTHNSVFAAHRLQCRMTIRKIDIRHFVVSSIPCRCFNRGSGLFPGRARRFHNVANCRSVSNDGVQPSRRTTRPSQATIENVMRRSTSGRRDCLELLQVIGRTAIAAAIISCSRLRHAGGWTDDRERLLSASLRSDTVWRRDVQRVLIQIWLYVERSGLLSSLVVNDRAPVP